MADETGKPMRDLNARWNGPGKSQRTADCEKSQTFRMLPVAPGCNVLEKKKMMGI